MNQGIDIAHAKLRGEWAEMLFMTQAAQHGLVVSRPFGDTSPYDFAVEHAGRFLRVQVKCTKYKRGNSYKCNLTSNGLPYPSDCLDFFAAYVIPANAWYILPVKAIHHQEQILLSPHRRDAKYETYREAWHLLRATPQTCPWRKQCQRIP